MLYRIKGLFDSKQMRSQQSPNLPLAQKKTWKNLFDHHPSPPNRKQLLWSSFFDQ